MCIVQVDIREHNLSKYISECAVSPQKVHITGCTYTKQQVLNMEKDITHYYYLEDMLYVDCTIRPGETFVWKLSGH